MADTRKIAVVLINMGGPSDLSRVRRFLFRLFNDRHIIDIPQPWRGLLAFIISTARTGKASEHYRIIGGGSPLIRWTGLQAAKLKEHLTARNIHAGVVTAFSYSPPLIGKTMAELAPGNYDLIVGLPLYPQYSRATFGSVEEALRREAKRHGWEQKLKIVAPFYNHGLYIKLSAASARKAIMRIDGEKPYRVIFTAHSLPQKLIDAGDPYQQQVEETVRLTAEAAGIGEYILSYQSRVGPVKWLRPSTIEVIRKTASSGVKQVVVVPVGFVCDHIETLYELDMELAQLAREGGVENFIRAEVPNDHDDFVELLSDLVIRDGR